MAPPKGTGAHCSKWADVFFFNQGYQKLSDPMQFKPQLTLGIDVLIREQRQHLTLALLGKYLIFLKCGSLDLNVLLTNRSIRS
jgi:hypothetical protein